MTDTFDREAVLAYRRRIQLQALYHYVGKSAPGHVVMRFRNAGTWHSSIAQPVPENLHPVLSHPDHPHRMPLPDGPLVVVLEKNTRGVIEVSEHLLSQESSIRLAALHHFLKAQSSAECWVSPYVLDLLKKSEKSLADADESKWISVGLALRDAVNHDFLVNCAGARQASKLQFNESYQEYLGKIIRPRAHSFDHDRPPICSPADEKEQVLEKFAEWSLLDNLGTALNGYLAFCGYLPLAGELSAGSLVEAWKKRHSDIDIWTELWKWVESCPNVLANYHAAHAFLEHPKWIRDDSIDKLLNVVRSVMNDAANEGNQDPLWELRANLLQHYQLHLESSIPGGNSEVVSVAACWLSNIVAEQFYPDSNHVKKVCEFLQRDVLPLSWRRWSLARSTMTPSPLRTASHYTPFIWSDSLLATAVRQFVNFPDFQARDDYRTFLLTRLTTTLCTGGLRMNGPENPVYAFQSSVSPFDLGSPTEQVSNEVEVGAKQVFAARQAIEANSNLQLHIAELRDMPDELCSFLCACLQCLQAELNADSAIQALLNDEDWRRAVFGRLSLDTLGSLIAFLIDWQLQQNEEWLLRLPHLFAFECENSVEPERIELLLSATIYSAMAADIASPVVRLLVGAKQPDIVSQFELWRRIARDIARDSEPWLASRVRGFLGALDTIL
jgi:hypothetical protein